MSKTNNFSNPFMDMFNNMYKDKFMNMDGTSDNMKKNADVMMKLGQMSLENSQAILRKTGEITQKNISDAVEATRDFMSSSNPEVAMEKQNNFVKEATAKAINNHKEIFEMASKSMFEAYDIFNKNLSETVDATRSEKKPSTK